MIFLFNDVRNPRDRTPLCRSRTDTGQYLQSKPIRSQSSTPSLNNIFYYILNFCPFIYLNESATQCSLINGQKLKNVYLVLIQNNISPNIDDGLNSITSEQTLKSPKEDLTCRPGLPRQFSSTKAKIHFKVNFFQILGTFDMINNFSGTPRVFHCNCPPGLVYCSVYLFWGTNCRVNPPRPPSWGDPPPSNPQGSKMTSNLL